jgi:RNA polymerase sigma-70 factor (ECF subfamily)
MSGVTRLAVDHPAGTARVADVVPIARARTLPPDAIPFDREFAAVLRAAGLGEERAVARLFREYQPGLVRYLRSRVPDVADDVASETWLAVASGLACFEGDADAFRAWLFTIARRRLIDQRRKAKRRPLEVVNGEALAGAASTSRSPEDEVEANVAGDEAARRIAALLPAEQADVILLRVVAGLSVEEVAGLLGKRPGTVRVLQHRGLRRLADRMAKNL